MPVCAKSDARQSFRTLRSGNARQDSGHGKINCRNENDRSFRRTDTSRNTSCIFKMIQLHIPKARDVLPLALFLFHKNFRTFFLTQCYHRSADKIRDRITRRTPLETYDLCSLYKSHVLKSAAHTPLVEQSLYLCGSAFMHIMQRLCCIHSDSAVKDTFSPFRNLKVNYSK